MAKVIVTVDTAVSPPKFTFTPMTLPIRTRKETIHWERAAANYRFAALAFDHTNPFSNIVVTDEKSTADDDNQREEDHAYVVLISIEGKYYSSKNLTMGGQGPIIRNN